MVIYMKDVQLTEKIKLIVARLIVGSIGIFVEQIALPRSAVAFARAALGTLVLLPVFLLNHKNFSFEKNKKNAFPLLLSGIALGFNWMLLFEAFNYTSVQVATLCYYMAPVFVILVSPVFLKERLSSLSILCTLGAVVGAVMISGVFGGEIAGGRGILLGLAAAVLYASVIILNKKINGISGIERTFFQLLVSAVVMFVYVIFTEDMSVFLLPGKQTLLLLVLGVLHTGVVYILFFTSISKLSAQTASILSYIDPVAAIILSGIFLNESMDAFQIIGMLLIISFALINELVSIKKS